ncbi:MAG TPA: TIGR00282 family metallophosphoesterase [Spirochaetota bacterium]|nr:TIGR00282 family metallophosphoesterase [Spirochaetota bacterium]HPH03148.1 TIGR00282 family metallophosphoesterase [Spirochaetota bacterium]HPN82879.1 TIGR00282 family metallophosphoesterase [Spirochaetota bacterium]
MKIIAVGDVVGRPGRQALLMTLPGLVKEHAPCCVIVNGENAAGGFGISARIAEAFLTWGVDVITTGNHVWRNKDVFKIIETERRLLRPLNYPEGAPGKGSVLVEKNGVQVGVINIMGRVFMDPLDCPFKAARREVHALKRAGAKIVVVDFHAEATSEKAALGHYLDGEASLVFGTHTHVQTNDPRILPGGTGFVTDVGMTGATDSVIGVMKEKAMRKFVSGMPAKFDLAEGGVEINYAIAEIDQETGRTVSIGVVRRKVVLDDGAPADTLD